MKGDSHLNTIIWPLPSHGSPRQAHYLLHIHAHGFHVGRYTTQLVTVLWPAPTLSPSILLAWAISSQTIYLIYNPTYLKLSHFSYLPAYEDGTDSVPKRRIIKFRRRGITQKKACNIQDKAKVWNQRLMVGLLSQCQVIDWTVSKYKAGWVFPRP